MFDGHRTIAKKGDYAASSCDLLRGDESGRRVSNPRPSAWEADSLYFKSLLMKLLACKMEPGERAEIAPTARRVGCAGAPHLLAGRVHARNRPLAAVTMTILLARLEAGSCRSVPVAGKVFLDVGGVDTPLTFDFVGRNSLLTDG
jgi:hypothetical protein